MIFKNGTVVARSRLLMTHSIPGRPQALYVCVLLCASLLFGAPSKHLRLCIRRSKQEHIKTTSNGFKFLDTLALVYSVPAISSVF